MNSKKVILLGCLVLTEFNFFNWFQDFGISIEKFLSTKNNFNPAKIASTALPFDTEVFKTKIKEFIDEKI